MRQKDNHIKEQIQVRACLKNHSRNLHAPLCGIFHPNSVAVARYGALIRAKYPTKCDAHLAESLFQTRSNLYLFFYMVILLPHGYYIRILYQKPFRN